MICSLHKKKKRKENKSSTSSLSSLTLFFLAGLVWNEEWNHRLKKTMRQQHQSSGCFSRLRLAAYAAVSGDAGRVRCAHAVNVRVNTHGRAAGKEYRCASIHPFKSDDVTIRECGPSSNYSKGGKEREKRADGVHVPGRLPCTMDRRMNWRSPSYPFFPLSLSNISSVNTAAATAAGSQWLLMFPPFWTSYPTASFLNPVHRGTTTTKKKNWWRRIGNHFRIQSSNGFLSWGGSL